jgi:hypothetical protein
MRSCLVKVDHIRFEHALELLLTEDQVVLQKLAEAHNGQGFPFLLGLGSHSKEGGDEGGLTADIAFAHLADLSLPDHVHDLIALQRSLSSSRSR